MAHSPEHTIRLRVRYAETDRMGIAHHSAYYLWFELCRTEHFRALGLPYTELEERGVFLPVVEGHCRYRSGVGYDELISVTSRIVEARGARIKIAYEVRDARGRMAAEGWTVHARVGPDGRPGRIPEDVIKVCRGDSP
ncbi:MAG: acyl-CoA thioesterase [Nitrospinota bacterium]